MVHYLLKEEGLLVGILQTCYSDNEGPSSGLNVVGALYMACLLGPGHTIVTVLCDSGGNYKSKAWNREWLVDNNIVIERSTPQDFITAFNQDKIVVSLK
jgi:cysteine synthase A